MKQHTTNHFFSIVRMLNSKSVKRTINSCIIFSWRKQRQERLNEKLTSFRRSFNTTFSRKNLKLFFLVITIIPIFLNSCTKKDIQIDNTNAQAINQKFFGNDLKELSPKVLEVITEFKKRNDLYPDFIENFIGKYGIPVWNKSIAQAQVINASANITNFSTKQTTTDNNDPTNILIIPIVKDNDSIVLAYIKATVSDSIHLSIETANKYAILDSITIKNNSKDIERIAIGFMQLNKSVFRYSQFKIRNLSLFNYLPKENNHLKRTIELPNEAQNIRPNLVGCTEIIATDGSWICTTPWATECQDAPDGCDHCGYPLCYWTSQQSITITVCDNPFSSGGIPSLGTGSNPSTGGGVSTTNPTLPCTGSGDIIGGLLPCGNPELGGWEPDKFAKDENGFYYTRINVLNSLLRNNPSILLPCDSLSLMPFETYGPMYQRVGSFKVPQNVINSLDSVNQLFSGTTITPPFGIQDLDFGTSTYARVNCDYFPVRIKALPPGYTPKSLVEYFRKNINNFINGTPDVTFSPYNQLNINYTNWFNSSYQNSVGALVSIHDQMIPVLLHVNATVVISDYYISDIVGDEKARFKFATITEPVSGTHPVSGNREFGIFADPTHPGEYSFYTMGVDRVTDILGTIISGTTNFGYERADKLWTRIQEQMAAFIIANGGNAESYTPKNIKARPKWNEAQKFLKGEIDFTELKRRLGC